MSGISPPSQGRSGSPWAGKEAVPARLPFPLSRPEEQEAAAPWATQAAAPARSARRGDREGPGGRTDPMAADPTEQRLGSLPVFTRGDFESDWRLVASGGFSRVFQARHRRWPTECAINCSLPPARRHQGLPATPSPFSEEKLRPGKLWTQGACEEGVG